jgi:hypothetical protein
VNETNERHGASARSHDLFKAFVALVLLALIVARLLLPAG